MIDAGHDVMMRAPGATYLVIVAASTGGPRAIAKVISQLPARLGAAVLVVQHMPRGFTTNFARHLDQLSTLRVSEGVDGEMVLRDRVYVAPGGAYMRVAGTPGNASLLLDHEIDAARVSPSADLLLESATVSFGQAITGVILTGMGRDGSYGLRAVRRAGGHAIVQDRTTSVIYGMPQSA